MPNPENAAGRTMHTIHDRLQRAQSVLRRPQSAEEKLFAALFTSDTPIARSELMASIEQAQKLISSADNIRTWVMEHGTTYKEEDLGDEEGREYKGGGFNVIAEDVEKPSSRSEKFLLGIVETSSPHDSSATVWFGIMENIGDNKYSLTIDFPGAVKDGKRIRRGQNYESQGKSFREMPEDDATIIEDLLERVTAHLTEQS